MIRCWIHGITFGREGQDGVFAIIGENLSTGAPPPEAALEALTDGKYDDEWRVRRFHLH